MSRDDTRAYVYDIAIKGFGREVSMDASDTPPVSFNEV